MISIDGKMLGAKIPCWGENLNEELNEQLINFFFVVSYYSAKQCATLWPAIFNVW